MLVSLAILLWVGLAVLHAGMLFPDLQAFMADSYPELPKKDYRKDLGTAVFAGMTSACLGPLGTVIVLCITGFAEHGWRLR